MTSNPVPSPPVDASLEELYRRPGFLIRRAHQIAVSMFLEETAELGVTTTQYGVMVILRARANLDQVGLATLVGIDRSTTALVVGKLEADGLIERRADPGDKRRKVLALTPAGHAMLDRLAEPARRTREREMAAFSAVDGKRFLKLLQQFVDTFNEHTRAPIKPRNAEGRRRKAPAPRKPTSPPDGGN